MRNNITLSNNLSCLDVGILLKTITQLNPINNNTNNVPNNTKDSIKLNKIKNNFENSHYF